MILANEVIMPGLVFFLFSTGLAFALDALRLRRFTRAFLCGYATLTLADISFDASGARIETTIFLLCFFTAAGVASYIRLQRNLNQPPDALIAVLPTICISAMLNLLQLSVCFMPWRMDDEFQSEAISPDGVYKAVMSYNDGLTFGYQHLDIHKVHPWWPFEQDTEVTEMCESGIKQMHWDGPRKLVVEYYGSGHKDVELKDYIVYKADHFEGVNISYVGVQPEPNP
ncbi:MAG: hypothetical protein ABJA67_17180 [Chthonomonadales bacterium]